ncbi:hypothetical protein HDU76_005406 [Blyttiomyces sp. JEL0837]|nr:hypothetical protein HDU76_005406 [Blyttiomyces sp. JEL0837]
MLQKTNQYRKTKGLLPLKLDRRLVAVAQAHSDDMAANSFVNHNSSDGSDWYNRVGTYLPNWNYLAERAYTSNESRILQTYIASPEHNQNLLNNQSVFFGSGFTKYYWTQDFAATMPGDIPFLVDCDKEDGHLWKQPAGKDKDYVGTVKTSEGLCLDVQVGYFGVGLLLARTCVDGSQNQLWVLKQQGAGFYVKSVGTNLCVDVKNASLKAGAAVGVSACTGEQNQQFMADDNGSWIAFHSGSCLDLPKSGIVHVSGTPVQQWPCNGGKNQMFRTISANDIQPPQTPCDMLRRTNDYRSSKGLPSLALDRRLVASAQFHADDMALHQFLDHNSSDGTVWHDRVAKYFPTWQSMEENVGAYTNDAGKIMDAYIASPEHDANLLNPSATHFGSGYNSTYWCQDFVLPQPNDIPFPIDCNHEDGYAWPQPAKPNQTFNGVIQSANGLCLEAGWDVGAPVTLNFCDPGNRIKQLWTLRACGAGFCVEVIGTPMCLDVIGGSMENGATVAVSSALANLFRVIAVDLELYREP